MAARKDVARNTRAVASTRSMRRVSAGRAGARRRHNSRCGSSEKDTGGAPESWNGCRKSYSAQRQRARVKEAKRAYLGEENGTAASQRGICATRRGDSLMPL